MKLILLLLLISTALRAQVDSSEVYLTNTLISKDNQGKHYIGLGIRFDKTDSLFNNSMWSPVLKCCSVIDEVDSSRNYAIHKMDISLFLCPAYTHRRHVFMGKRKKSCYCGVRVNKKGKFIKPKHNNELDN